MYKCSYKMWFTLKNILEKSRILNCRYCFDATTALMRCRVCLSWIRFTTCEPAKNANMSGTRLNLYWTWYNVLISYSGGIFNSDTKAQYVFFITYNWHIVGTNFWFIYLFSYDFVSFDCKYKQLSSESLDVSVFSDTHHRRTSSDRIFSI